MPRKTQSSSPPLAVRLEPADGFTAARSAQMPLALTIDGAAPTDLATLALWINGVEVTGALDPDSTLHLGDTIRIELPTLDFDAGLHHVRVSLSDEFGTRAAIDEAFYSVGDTGRPGAVRGPRGLLVAARAEGEAAHGKGCCCYRGGGGAGQPLGGMPPAGGQPVSPPVQPPMDGGGPGPAFPPDPNDDDDPDPDCKITLLESQPGLIVPEDRATASVRLATDPADAQLLFSQDIAVTYIAANQFLLAGRSLAEVTRAELSRKGASVLQEVVLPAGGFVNRTGPKSVDFLISQINQFFRGAGSLATLTFQAIGVPVRVRLSVKCRRGGRRGSLNFIIRDA